MEQQTLKKTNKVLVTVIHQGWVRPEMFSCLRTIENDVRAESKIIFVRNRPYENAINDVFERIRKQGFDYLIMFDHDNIPTRNPIDLISFDKDVIGMPYLGFQYNNGRLELAFLAMDKQSNGGYLDHRDMQGLQEVDAVASGAMIVARRVIEHKDVFFTRRWERGVATKGADFFFCEKAKQAGFKIFAHYDYKADHFKEMSLLDILNSRIYG